MAKAVLPLLDELRILAQNGLAYADSPYDEERYTRILDLVSEYYGEISDIPKAEVQSRFEAELGYVTPKVGAQAALFNEEEEILLLKRSDDKKWCLPGGATEPGESPEETAVRETREETGLSVRPATLVGLNTRRPDTEYGPHSHVSATYLCEITGGTLRGSHESDDLQWWTIEHVTEWHKDHHKFAIRAQKEWMDE
ncbi:NUDIX hydrolase N-terminal domain-containing protein [Halocatena marina]|uniref:NUDIX hydrolase N-terminal domain-containing protein n=1 Tax=Halocatena marina TaxID=2934937 RepID=UPI00200E2DF2|nr:NUDIX hydrolase N-terminal domain-containing protein [Halocatena marina]